MTLLLIDTQRENLRQLAQIALRKHGEGVSPAAATRHLLNAAIHLHAVEVGSAQAVLDAAEHMADLAANHRVCSRPPATSDPPEAA